MSRTGDVVEKKRVLDVGIVVVVAVAVVVVVVGVGIDLDETLEAVRTRASGLLRQDPTWFILWHKDSSIVSTWAQWRCRRRVSVPGS